MTCPKLLYNNIPKVTGGFWFDQEGEIFGLQIKVPESKVLLEINYYDEIPIDID